MEQQHKTELESYRGELNKWQAEADALRQQLSENRVLLTKGNISLMKELQEKDDKIHELSLTCQQLQVGLLYNVNLHCQFVNNVIQLLNLCYSSTLQNEIELMESVGRPQQMTARVDTKTNETAYSSHRDQVQQQNQVDILRRQLQSLMEKEKMYKYEISDLKQQLSRRYMLS